MKNVIKEAKELKHVYANYGSNSLKTLRSKTRSKRPHITIKRLQFEVIRAQADFHTPMPKRAHKVFKKYDAVGIQIQLSFEIL